MHASRSKIWSIESLNSEFKKKKIKENKDNFCFKRQDTNLWALIKLLGVNNVTESQNHRMAGARRDLWGPYSPTPLPKQVHLTQVTQDHVQVGVEYLRTKRLHKLPGQPVPVLCQPQSKVLPRVQLEHPMLHFVPVVPCLVAGQH